MSETVNIGNRRELFWDDFLIDTARTTAVLKLHRLQPRDVAVNHDEPWEGDGCDFHCIVADDGLFRMYYLGWETMNPDVTQHVLRPIVVCYAESGDGKTWVKPDLAICEFEGSKSNNIILDHHTAKFDNFSVFKDTNSACPEDERYKGVGLDGNSYHATYNPCRVALKPFIFTGDTLSINFATSAAGYVKIRLRGGDTTLESIELFGDSLDRTVEFGEDGLASLSGRPVEMEIAMSDADIYSFQFR